MVSAVNALIKHAGINPNTTHATFRECREPLNSIEPVAARIRPGTYMTQRAYLRVAFIRYARGYDARSRSLGKAWLTLKAGLIDYGAYRRLITFVRWCNVKRIRPADVNDENGALPGASPIRDDRAFS